MFGRARMCSRNVLRSARVMSAALFAAGSLSAATGGTETGPALDLSFDVAAIRTQGNSVAPLPALPTGEFTAAFRVKPLDYRMHNCSSRWEKSSCRLVASDGSGYYDGFRMGLNCSATSVTPLLNLGGPNGAKGFLARATAPLNQWLLVIWTCDATNVSCYVNGDPAGTWPRTQAWTPARHRFTVGESGHGQPPLPGAYDYVRVWPRAMCAAEVEAMTLPYFPARQAARLTEAGRWAEARAIYAKLGDWTNASPAYVQVEPKRPVAPPPQTAQALYVAPTGDDSADGSLAHPLATWSAAAARVRTLKAQGATGGVTVYFRGGDYPMRDSVRLTKADAGRADFPIVYIAYPGEHPVFRGDVDLPPFAPVTDEAAWTHLTTAAAREHVRVCDLKQANIPYAAKAGCVGRGMGRSGGLEALYLDGAWQLPARHPNDGFLHATNVVDATNRIFRADAAVGPMADWAKEPDLMGCGYFVWCWLDFTVPLRTDPEANTFTVDAKLPAPLKASWNPEMNYFLCNALRCLDAPGEWFLDRVAGKLYFWPPKSGRAHFPVCAAPFLELDNLSHVQIRGLSFTGGLDKFLVAKQCANLIFASNRVTNFGGEGVNFRNLKDSVIWGNVFRGFGAAALEITGGDRKALDPSGIRLENNEICECSRTQRTYAPGLRLYGCGTKVVYNHFHHIRSSAMRLEGNDFLISMNLVDHVVTESGDQGGVDIYNNPSYQGNVYSYNIWRDIGCRGHGQGGIRFDDRICGQVVYGNRFDNASDGKHFGGVQINAGRRNVIDNNVFTRCDLGVTIGGIDGERWKAVFETPDFIQKLTKQVNIYAPPYTTRYPGIETLKDDVPQCNHLTRNVFVGPGQFLRARSAHNDCRRNWQFATTPDLAELARETCFSPLPPEREIGTY